MPTKPTPAGPPLEGPDTEGPNDFPAELAEAVATLAKQDPVDQALLLETIKGVNTFIEASGLYQPGYFAGGTHRQVSLQDFGANPNEVAFAEKHDLGLEIYQIKSRSPDGSSFKVLLKDFQDKTYHPDGLTDPKKRECFEDDVNKTNQWLDKPIVVDKLSYLNSPIAHDLRRTIRNKRLLKAKEQLPHLSQLYENNRLRGNTAFILPQIDFMRMKLASSINSNQELLAAFDFDALYDMEENSKNNWMARVQFVMELEKSIKEYFTILKQL